MFSVNHISKSFGYKPILKDVSFNIRQNELIGLVGENGCGKSTLLRILTGQETPDAGHVTSKPELRIGYLSQDFEIDPKVSLEQVTQRISGNIKEIEFEINRLSQQLCENPEDSDLQTAFDHAIRRLDADHQSQNKKMAVLLNNLGLGNIPENQPVGRLSRGQKTRLSLALVMVQEPELLLLDEPTNHLDIAMLEWLEGWINSFKGSALIVSHDRAFLDRTVQRLLVISSDDHTIHGYEGNYSDYLNQYHQELKQRWIDYREQEAEIQKMELDIQRTKQQSLKVELSTTPRQPVVRRIAKKVAKKAKSRERKLERFLKSDRRVEKPKAGWQMKLEFQPPIQSGKDVLKLHQLDVGYEDYPPILSNLDLNIRVGERVVLTGQNGCGKTTLLRTIAGVLHPIGGTVQIGVNVRVGFMAQEQEFLDPQLSALATIQNLVQFNETDTRSFLHYFLFTEDDPLRPIHSLSFGERARLYLAMLVVQGCNFLLLDEPINHLDIPSRERFEKALAQFNGTILAVLHDRYFIERFADTMWVVKNKSVQIEYLT